MPNRRQDSGSSYQDERTGLSKEAIKRDFLDNLYYLQGKFPALATPNDYYQALAYTVRNRLLQRWILTAETYTRNRSRTVAYLSAEFLLGPQLANNLLNLGIYDQVREAMFELGLNFDEILRLEPEPGLGNGGLGRLAACFLDSMATLEIPTLGYGIRYEFGIFAQEIRAGQQVELTDKWLRYGNPWELPRPDWAVEVKFGGEVQHYRDHNGRHRALWHPAWSVIGTPFDIPILGYRNHTANTLRLWRAEATEAFDLSAFNRGDYWGAVNLKVVSENLTKVLYPNDEQIQGKELRLRQQYFFVSCSLQDMLRIMRVQQIPLERFHEKFVVQLNDTHPAIAIAELMRLLVDEHAIDWEGAWAITRKTFAYTNHTLLPEALEQWPVELFARTLPRHLEIVYEINHRFLEEVRIRYLGDQARVRRLSLIGEEGERSVRMAHLACVGSFAVNGVSELHTQLLKQSVLADFHELWPDKIQNVTNGVTPRRWLALANPRLAALLNAALGERWVEELEQLKKLEPLVEDSSFRGQWRLVRRWVKEDFSIWLKRKISVSVDPCSLFDVQVKRIHEYKRQHLNLLHILSLYLRLKDNPNLDVPPRTFVFGGKAAPGYAMAKLIIRLILAVSEVIGRDPAVRDRLKVVFVPNFNVANAQYIYPAADLSEQISVAGKEASGTGNMKFALNGAVTIGTLDGANVELRQRVGAENFFAFGLTADQVQARLEAGYRPCELYYADPELKTILDLIADGSFSGGDREVFRPLVDDLLNRDPFLVLADFRAYLDCQARAGEAFCDQERWTRMSILNCARSGYFSSDRAVLEYAHKIWQVEPVPISEAEGAFWRRPVKKEPDHAAQAVGA
jgi:starch phosphorylase